MCLQTIIPRVSGTRAASVGQAKSQCSPEAVTARLFTARHDMHALSACSAGCVSLIAPQLEATCETHRLVGTSFAQGMTRFFLRSCDHALTGLQHRGAHPAVVLNPSIDASSCPCTTESAGHGQPGDATRGGSRLRHSDTGTGRQAGRGGGKVRFGPAPSHCIRLARSATRSWDLWCGRRSA